MRLILLGGAPGIGKSTIARAVLAHHRGDPGSVPLLQWIDIDALWLHQPWRVDRAMRSLVAANLQAVLDNAERVGVEAVLVSWTFHSRELREVVTGVAPLGSRVTTIQLVADASVWRARFERDPDRPPVDAFFEARYAAAQSVGSDVVIDTSALDAEEVARAVAAMTLQG